MPLPGLEYVESSMSKFRDDHQTLVDENAMIETLQSEIADANTALTAAQQAVTDADDALIAYLTAGSQPGGTVNTETARGMIDTLVAAVDTRATITTDLAAKNAALSGAVSRVPNELAQLRGEGAALIGFVQQVIAP